MHPGSHDPGHSSPDNSAADSPASTGYFVIGLCILLIVGGLFAIGVFPSPFR